MTVYQTPGVYVEEIPSGTRPIAAVGTSTAAFLGVATRKEAPKHRPTAVNNWSQFVEHFVDRTRESTPLINAVHGFFSNGGSRCFVVNVGDAGSIVGGGAERQGVDCLEVVDEIAVVAAPGFTDPASYEALLGHCEKMEDRVAILDSPEKVESIEALTKVAQKSGAGTDGEGKSGAKALRPRNSDGGYGAFYFPWIFVNDALQPAKTALVPPSGHIAGVFSRTDSSRGVHKAPANEPLRGALGLSYQMTRAEQGVLNPAGVNCIRYFSSGGIRVWGARTLAPQSSEWRYLNVRRLVNMIKESIVEGTGWAVFEPNDRILWKSVERDIRAFLRLLWQDGALMGATPEQAFFVKCDAETNPPEVIDAGRLVTVIGIAPVKPAEFIVFRIGQWAGGAETAGEGQETAGA